MTATMSFDISLAAPHAAAVDRVVDALKAEGFGVLSRIDIHEALKEKLNVEFRPYTILGACNPPLAHRALSAVPEVGLFLPCNVTVEETGAGESLVRIVNPGDMMKAGGFDTDATVREVGREATERLQRVAELLAG